MPYGEVAAIVFTNIKDPLYIVPRKILTPNLRNAYNLTNSQRNKLNNIFKIGNNVEFNVGKDNKVTNIDKCATIRELYLAQDGTHVVRFCKIELFFFSYTILVLYLRMKYLSFIRILLGIYQPMLSFLKLFILMLLLIVP